jgi:hypothetical protein
MPKALLLTDGMLLTDGIALRDQYIAGGGLE